MENIDQSFSRTQIDGLEEWAKLESRNDSATADLLQNATGVESPSNTRRKIIVGVLAYLVLAAGLVAACWFGKSSGSLPSSDQPSRHAWFAPKYATVVNR